MGVDGGTLTDDEGDGVSVLWHFGYPAMKSYHPLHSSHVCNECPRVMDSTARCFHSEYQSQEEMLFLRPPITFER